MVWAIDVTTPTNQALPSSTVTFAMKIMLKTHAERRQHNAQEVNQTVLDLPQPLCCLPLHGAAAFIAGFSFSDVYCNGVTIGAND